MLLSDERENRNCMVFSGNTDMVLFHARFTTLTLHYCTITILVTIETRAEESSSPLSNRSISHSSKLSNEGG